MALTFLLDTTPRSAALLPPALLSSFVFIVYSSRERLVRRCNPSANQPGQKKEEREAVSGCRRASQHSAAASGQNRTTQLAHDHRRPGSALSLSAATRACRARPLPGGLCQLDRCPPRAPQARIKMVYAIRTECRIGQHIAQEPRRRPARHYYSVSCSSCMFHTVLRRRSMAALASSSPYFS